MYAADSPFERMVNRYMSSGIAVKPERLRKGLELGEFASIGGITSNLSMMIEDVRPLGQGDKVILLDSRGR